MSHLPDKARRLAFPLLAGLLALLASAKDGSAAYLNAPTTLQVAQGATITVPINLVTDASGVSFLSIDIALSFDANLFTVSNVRAGGLTDANSGSGFTGAFNTSFSGQINATQSGSKPLSVAANLVSPVMLFDLTAKQNAPTGPTPINILAQGFVVVTAIDEGTIPLVPAPTNGFDLGVDGSVTIVAVPEPASAALLALGGGFALAERRRRRLRLARPTCP